MKTLRQINIKNCPNYFLNSMTNIKNLDTNLLSINQISFTSTDSIIYDIGEIKAEIETIRGIEPIKYEKDFMKIKFESDYDLPLGKILNTPVCVILVQSIFQENDKYYPQIYLKDSFPVCVILFKSVFQENNKYYPQIYLKDSFLSMSMNMKMILILLVKVLIV